MGLSDSVRLKLNGTFKRELLLLDEDDCIFNVVYRIQTALWYNSETDKWQYVSIFPSFIKRYYQPSLNMLEYISCGVKKDDSIFKCIDDPEAILDSEDRISRLIRHLEKGSSKANYPALLNSKYTEVYNKPLSVLESSSKVTKRFPILYLLVLTARQFFGKQNGVLSLVNTVISL